MSKDTIYREDAIDAIECVRWYHQNRNKDMVSGANSAEDQAWYKAEDIYDALKAVPSADRPQGEWIPCSERLPKPYMEVLVCDEWGWISLGSYRPCDVTEKDSGWSTHTRIKMPTNEVVAWMPLPKPWEGADNE